MKKKVLSMLLVLLIVISLVPFTLLTAAAEELGNIMRDALDTSPRVSIEAVEKHAITNTSADAPAKPGADGYAYFIIKATGEITGDITVHYTTEDLSAIASANDYEAKSGSVVLTKENPEVRIMVKTSRAEYSINLNVHGGSKNYSYISRSFLVKLTGVEGNAVLDNGGDDGKDRTQVECALLAEHSLDAYQFDSASVLTPYTWYGKYDIVNALNTEEIDFGEYISKKYNVSFPSSWSADYVNSGINANLYMSLQNAHINESWWNSDGELTVYIAGVAIQLKGEFHNNEEFGWGPAMLYGLYGISDINGEKNKLKDYFNENFISIFWSVDGRFITIDKDKQIMEYAVANNNVIVRKWQYYGETNSINADPGMFYIRLDDSVLSWSAIEIALDGNEGYARRLSGGDISFRLEDVTAPEIAKGDNGAYAIYHNFNTAKAGEKLRLAIRFNEPVQIDGKDPYVTGKINGVGSGIEPHPYAIRFNYVGGSGSDTLYFEAEYNGNYQINSITDLTFTHASSIKDFAGSANAFAPEAGIVIDGFNLDKRDPIISVAAIDSKMHDWARAKKISVTVSNISEDAILYYTWTDSTAAPEKYDSKLTLTDVSVNGTKTATITGDGNGAKYLHLKAVTRFGREQSIINVVNNNAVTMQRYLGPYRFDNTAPTVDEAKLLPQAGSSMSQKNYLIPTPNDNGSGFDVLKMYYVGLDGQNHLIESKVYSVSSFTNSNGSYHDLSFVLDANEVGVGENTRREVTLFFTLTDNAGNTDSDVARHRVVFDTNTYIEVESAGPVNSFVDETEVTDDGQTFIYHGNAEVTYTDSYYGFMIRVPEANLEGTTEISILYNGKRMNVGEYGITRFSTLENGIRIANFKIDFLRPMTAGYYDVEILAYENEVGTDDVPYRRTAPYRIYVGTGKGKLDAQISQGTMLINKVYQLPTSSYFYYMDKSGTIGTVIKEAYNNTTLAASFSSQQKAYGYVLFNEYRDIYAITLTAELAEALNAGNSNAQKALGEQTVAREGQVWIRYKSSTWDVGKAPISSDWVFYYYGTTDEIDISRFSSILTEALDSVADRISARGNTVALAEYSIPTGSVSSLLDKLGAPYLAPAQIHAADKRLSDENCNSTFLTDIVYTADTAIYSSAVVIGGIEYTLLGNVVVPEGSRYQYKRIDENGITDEEWSELVFTAGDRFSDALGVSGRYLVRELGSGGVSVFNVYIDKDAPMVLVSWKDKDGVNQSQLLNQSSEEEFRARSLKIVGIDSREYDKYSYVAFYNASNSKLYGVYTFSELQTAAVDLPDGNYHMVVSDRTGNRYTMKIFINSSQLNCEIRESENVKIKFTCDRKESQIQEFYVKRNGVLVSGKYASELEFTESGTYEFYVRDIYGNVFGPMIYEFDRIYPEIVWKYRDQTGYYVTYSAQNKTRYFTLESVVDGTYTISTSVSLRFQIPSNYRYTFLGTLPEHDKNMNDGTVTIKEGQSFQLKVFYEKHPDVYTVYNCISDASAPVIEVSVRADNPVPDELAELKAAIESGLIAEGQTVLIPSKISYSSSTTEIKHIANKDTVLTDFIKVNVSDESGLAYVHVYLDGELIKTQGSANSLSNVILSKAGEYLIVAEDALGNKSEFTFTNGTPESLRYLVDGWPIKLGLHDFENFDENGNYLDGCFGNESVEFVIPEHMNIFYMISDDMGARYFVAFEIKDGAVREMYYCIGTDGSVVLSVKDSVLFDKNNSKTVWGKDYPIYAIDAIGVDVFARVDVNGNVVLSVYTSEEHELTVEARLNTNSEFYYTKTQLSSFSADLTISTSEGVLQIGETDDLIKLNRPFEISDIYFDRDKISYVAVFYSKINDFKEMGFFDKDEIYSDGKIFEDEGFYFIMLVNKYGNDSSFLVHISYKFDVSSYSVFADGEKSYYSASYTETIYSNSKVVLEVYATGASVRVTKNGVDFQPVLSFDNGITYVILSDPGSYTVSITDSYRNTIERCAVIDTSRVSFNEDLLTGYNENALKKDEGYTNRKLSVSKAVLDQDMISYLAVEFDGDVYVIFDRISEAGIILDESKLINCIGSLGDGVYTLIARNIYGAITTKVIHYRETPTLELEREIRSSTKTESYDISKALLVGFWSNGELTFKTHAEYYEFTINGDKTECPKTLSFAGSSQHGHSEYEITYVDEYGFSYSFKAYLVRQDVEIKADIGSNAQLVDGVLTTNGNVAVTFPEGMICTYTWNNSKEKAYTPGEKLSRDGVYRFVVVDHAGNMSALTVKKDTTVEFAFIKVSSTAQIENGGVVNSSKVGFEVLNGDSAFIEKVFKNGVEQADFSGSKFAEDGKWEIIVSDKLGNKAYFSFYIISKEKNGFAYTTPYEYHVTELWYDSGDGVKISYIKFVNHNETSSSFMFDENGKYAVVMTSDSTGEVSRFEFTVNTTAPAVSLVGCNTGDTTKNDVTITGCRVGDKIKVYKSTRTGEKLVQQIEVATLATKMPTINEGGEYRIVVESEAGVQTELTFARKHVMNTEGSIFVVIVISVAVVGLFIGLVYRNKSKTDD